jgi:lipoate-protein ligase A
MPRMGIGPHGTLRVLLEPDLPGAENMRRDAELLEACETGRATGAVLRLYSWKPAAVSVGAMQDPARLLDLELCRAAGIDVVRRPTGGRAVLHADEITYAVVAATADPRFGTGLAGANATIGACLVAALGRLGIAAQLSRPTRDPQRRLLQRPCFVSAGRAEVLVDGRKLLGSAQRRLRRAFLQHGSLLVGPAHEGLVELLAASRSDAAFAAAMRDSLRRSTTTLAELLERRPGFDELAQALFHGFQETLSGPFTRCARSAPSTVPP